MADPKLPKAAVDYGPGKEAAHCGNCVHFQPGPDPFGSADCEIVIGKVHWTKWCNRHRRGTDVTSSKPFEGTEVSLTPDDH